MSIWTSVGRRKDDLTGIPTRDNYTGEPDPANTTNDIDVATSVNWHDLIRLSVDAPGVRTSILLTVDEVEVLVTYLRSAVARIIEARDDDA